MLAKKILIISIILLILVHTSVAVRTFKVLETEFVKISAVGFDADNDSLVYSYAKPLSSNGEWQTDYGDRGVYNTSISVSDGKNTITEPIQLIVEKKNRAAIATQNKITSLENELIDLKSFIQDPDDDVLDYKFEAPFNSEGKWKPKYDQNGGFITKVIVNDGSVNVTLRLKIEVADANQAPEVEDVFSKNLIFNIHENETIHYFVTAKDMDNDQISYVWMLDNKSISSQTKGDYYFNFNSSGDYKLVLQLKDPTHELTRQWNIHVDEVNRVPEISLLPLSVREGEEAILDLPQKDFDGDDLKYGFNAPFDSDGKWITDYNSSGVRLSEVVVSDGKHTITEKVKVTVLDVDLAPELHLPPELVVQEGEELVWKIDVKDLDDPRNTITFKNVPTTAIFDAQTKTFIWRPGYETIARRGGIVSDVLNALGLEKYFLDEEVIPVEVKSCGREKCSSGTVNIKVKQVNRAPQLKPIMNTTIQQGATLKLDAAAIDPDGDILRYYYSAPATKDGSFTADNVGIYTTYVTASDGVTAQTMPVQIKVEKKNVAPKLLIEKDEYIFKEGREFKIQVAAQDQNNDTVILTAENIPSGASFKQGQFSWTPGYQFTNSSEVVWVKFYASDDQFSTLHPVKIIVENSNRDPQTVDYYPKDPKIVVVAGTNQHFRITATDPDQDKLNYTWDFGSSEKVVGSNQIQRLFKYPGEKKVKVTVSDGSKSLTKEWSVIVQAPVQPRVEPPAVNIKVYYIEK